MKAALLGVERPVPIGERHAVGSLIGEAMQGIDERSEIFRRFGECGGPDDPIQLGVRLPIVER